MCNSWCIDFAASSLPHLDGMESVLEVGSRDVNGTTRAVLSDGRKKYVGIDIFEGSGVDKVLDVNELTKEFGYGSFDIVTSTEMIEHCKDWQDAIFQMLAVLKVGGIILLTTRSPGFELHDYPSDYWRFTNTDFLEIFSPIGDVLLIEDDMTLGWACGIGIVLRKTADLDALNLWHEKVQKMLVFSMDEEVNKERKSESENFIDTTPPVIIDWGPQKAESGVAFNLQANGHFAIWFTGKEFQNVSDILLGDNKFHLLNIVISNKGTLMSAELPPEVILKKNSYQLELNSVDDKKIEIGKLLIK